MHFPVVFSLKIVGTADSDLKAIIALVLQKYQVDTEHTRMSTRLSKEGNYTSYTVTFMAKNQEQLDNIYREISGNPQVLFML